MVAKKKAKKSKSKSKPPKATSNKKGKSGFSLFASASKKPSKKRK